MQNSFAIAALLSGTLLNGPAQALEAYDPYRPDSAVLAATPLAAKPGTGRMVVGIVFTPIFAVGALTSVVVYQSAATYDCNLYKDKEDGSTRGRRLADDREQCHRDRKSYMATWAPLAVGFSAGMGYAIYMIVSGAMERRGSASAQQGFDVFYSADRKAGILYDLPL